MFELIVKNANDMADMVDGVPYLYVALFATPVIMLSNIATAIVGLAITTQRRIKKFINKVLNEDEGE